MELSRNIRVRNYIISSYGGPSNLYLSWWYTEKNTKTFVSCVEERVWQCMGSYSGRLRSNLVLLRFVKKNVGQCSLVKQLSLRVVSKSEQKGDYFDTLFLFLFLYHCHLIISPESK